PRRPRRGRDDGRACAESLDIGSLFGAAKTRRTASDLSGASGARHGLRAGARFGRSAPEVQALAGKSGAIFSHDVQGHVAENGEIVGTVSQTAPVLILVHDDIEPPVQPIFDAPMRANDFVEAFG